MTTIITKSRTRSRRHFRQIMALLLATVLVIIIGNNVVFQLIKSPKNITTAQMIYGWARLYKPMIYPSAKPDAVAFGFSWVRDIFDPKIAGELTGETFFNFGMSGATSFESLRVLQHAMSVHKPKRVFLDLQSFADAPRVSLMENQFDERILDVNRDGSPNESAALQRTIKINTSGAAIAFNIRFLEFLWAEKNGTPREELLPSYQRRDWVEYSDAAEDARRWTSEYRNEPPDKTDGLVHSLNDLEDGLELLCNRNVEVFLVENPYICGKIHDMRRGHALIRKMQAQCSAPMSFWVFHYPNAVTMEGLSGIKTSNFYRPDGHPRPTLGQLMLTRMLGLEGQENAPPLPRDFGANLLAMSQADADAWLTKKNNRCLGQWDEAERTEVLEDLERLTPIWDERF